MRALLQYVAANANASSVNTSKIPLFPLSLFQVCVLNLQPSSLQILHDSDLKPYVVFLTPPSVATFRQQRQKYGGEAMKVRRRSQSWVAAATEGRKLSSGMAVNPYPQTHTLPEFEEAAARFPQPESYPVGAD